MSTMDNEGQDTSQVEDTSVANESGTETTQEGGSSDNPAWNDALGVIPEMLHSQVKPFFQQWDKNYQDGIQKVHSQYEPYKPYLEAQISPDQINFALQVAKAIEERPSEVIQALQEYVGTETDTTQGGNIAGEQGQEDIPEFLQHPEVQKMQQTLNTVAQILVQQNMISQQSMEDQMLSDELDSLQEKFKDKGGFDEEWVLTRAANNPNIPLENHVEAFLKWKQDLLTQSRKAPGPKVLSGSGNAPDSKADVKNLSDKDRRAHVAQLLQLAAQNND